MAELTEIVPVLKEHVGWINVAVGVDGFSGCAMIVNLIDGEEVQPAAFFAVT